MGSVEVEKIVVRDFFIKLFLGGRVGLVGLGRNRGVSKSLNGFCEEWE